MIARRAWIGLLASASSSAVAACGRTAAPAAVPPALPTAPLAPTARPAPANPEVILTTTTSTQDSGLLDVLLPLFERPSGYRVKPIAVGSGQALALGARGEADVLLSHAPEAELAWMAEGNGTQRLRVMYNDFIVLGPPGDPARTAGEPDAGAALAHVARARAPFISRGDNSGTHQAELALWRAAGIDPKGQPWYQETGQGMGATLNVASEKRAYSLADRSTYLARRDTVQLDVAFQGSPDLRNVYHVMPVSAARFPRVNAEGGLAFAHFMISREAQAAITSFGVDKYGQPLFFADAWAT